jgi:hypothetical protein
LREAIAQIIDLRIKDGKLRSQLRCATAPVSLCLSLGFLASSRCFAQSLRLLLAAAARVL